jgi:hypothetical protein
MPVYHGIEYEVAWEGSHTHRPLAPALVAQAREREREKLQKELPVEEWTRLLDEDFRAGAAKDFQLAQKYRVESAVVAGRRRAYNKKRIVELLGWET